MSAWEKRFDGRRATRAAAVRIVCAVALAGAAAVLPARATTVVAKSFRTIAVEADRVFAAVVSDVHSYRRGEDGPIWTAVRFGDVRWIAGGSGAETELEFAGGSIGDRAEVVGGMPQFKVGQRVLLFVHDAPSASPVVGFHQGCFALRDGEDVVITSDYRPVLAFARDELVIGEPGQTGGMSLAEFTALVGELRAESAR